MGKTRHFHDRAGVISAKKKQIASHMADTFPSHENPPSSSASRSKIHGKGMAVGLLTLIIGLIMQQEVYSHGKLSIHLHNSNSIDIGICLLHGYQVYLHANRSVHKAVGTHKVVCFLT